MLPTIQFGSSGRLTSALQCFVNVKIDGQFGNQTREAVISFQKANQLVTDGIVGLNTWTALSAQRPTLKIGSRGNDVRGLQYLLNITPDGQFGPITENSIIQIQTAANIRSDGICGVLTWGEIIIEARSSFPMEIAPVDYKQFDSRWGKVMFSNHNDPKQTIASSGCGPTAVADIVATWIDGTVTPVEMCNLAVNNGFRTYNSGVAQAFMPFAANQYGLKYSSTKSTGEVVSALNSGSLVVALMGPGYWTNGGHYILLWRADEQAKMLYANDPGSNARTKASESSFAAQSKNYFIFSK